MAEELYALALCHCQVKLDAVQSDFEIIHEVVCEYFLSVTASGEREVGIEVSDAKDEVRFDVSFCESLLAWRVRAIPLPMSDLQLLQARSMVIRDRDCSAKASCEAEGDLVQQSMQRWRSGDVCLCQL